MTVTEGTHVLMRSTGLTSASRATDTPPHDSHPAVGHPHHASSSGASHPPLVAPINHRGSILPFQIFFISFLYL